MKGQLYTVLTAYKDAQVHRCTSTYMHKSNKLKKLAKELQKRLFNNVGYSHTSRSFKFN